MPQELQVLTCYQCKTFQVQIVKKVPKWQCKMCGEKQSVKKVYFIGSGKECREIVQDLNTKRIQLEERQSILNLASDKDDLSDPGELRHQKNDSKWNTLLPESRDEEDDIDESESEKYTFERKTMKRKISKLMYSNEEVIYNKPKQSKTISNDNYQEGDNCRFKKLTQSNDTERRSNYIYTNKPAEAKFSKWDEACNEENEDTDNIEPNELTDCISVNEDENINTKKSTYPLKTVDLFSSIELPYKQKTNMIDDSVICNENEMIEVAGCTAAISDDSMICNQNKDGSVEISSAITDDSMVCNQNERFKMAGNTSFGSKIGKDLKSINIFEDDGDLDLSI